MTADPRNIAEVKQSIGWIIALSIGLMVLGVVALVAPVFASAFFTSTMGWIAILSGLIMVVQSFRSQPVRGFWLNLILGILYVVAGGYVLANVGGAMVALTLAFGWLFIVEGIYTIVLGVMNRAGQGSRWLVVLNGVVTLVLGILVINNWPANALWLIGLYVGVSLLMSGASLLAASLAVRQTLRRQEELGNPGASDNLGDPGNPDDPSEPGIA